MRYFAPIFIYLRSVSFSILKRLQTIGEISPLAARQSVKTNFVLLPTLYQVDKEAFNQYVKGFGVDTRMIDIDEPTWLVKDHFDACSLCVVDFFPVLRQEQAEGARLYGAINSHFTLHGHKTVTKIPVPILTRVILRSGQLISCKITSDDIHCDEIQAPPLSREILFCFR